jgi:hypothetical protein
MKTRCYVRCGTEDKSAKSAVSDAGSVNDAHSVLVVCSQLQHQLHALKQNVADVEHFHSNVLFFITA